MLILIKLILIILVICLWYWGGQKKGRIRDILVPTIIGIAIFILLKGDFFHRLIISVLSILGSQIIRLGYGNFSPEDDDHPSFLASIIKDRQGAIIRMLWGILVGAVTPLVLIFTGYLTLPSYIAYIVTNAGINYSVSKFRFPVMLADICVASAFGSLLFYIK